MAKRERGEVFRKTVLILLLVMAGIVLIQFYRSFRHKADLQDMVDHGFLIEGTLMNYELKSSSMPVAAFSLTGAKPQEKWIEVTLQYQDEKNQRQQVREIWDSRPEYAAFHVGSKVRMYYGPTNAFIRASSKQNQKFQEVWGPEVKH